MTHRNLGHNGGPPFTRQSGWHLHCWKKARANLIGPRMPIETVRYRVKRAKALGLSYPQYASALLGTGRDIAAFLFTIDGLHLRLQRRLEMPDAVRTKLAAVEGCMLTAFSPYDEDPAEFRIELQDVSGVPFAAAVHQPHEMATWHEAKSTVRSVLDQVHLPRDAVVMIGRGEIEKKWADAGSLAHFVSASTFFERSHP